MSSADPTVRPSALVAMKAGTDVVTVSTAGTAVEAVDSEFTLVHTTDKFGDWFSFDVSTGRLKCLKKIKRAKVTIQGAGVTSATADIMHVEVGIDGAEAGNTRTLLEATAGIEITFCLVDILTDIAKDAEISVMFDAAANGDAITLSDLSLAVEVLELAGLG